MASPSGPPPLLHILDKTDYSKHQIVTLPNEPLPPLGPSSLRLQSRILGLTTNNLTYARMGHFLGWYDIYPQPANTPAPFNNRSNYGRISAWGYAEILESTVPDIPAGHTVYGYLPTSTLPEDVEIEKTGFKDQIVVTNPHRQHLWKIYNRYQVQPPLPKLIESKGRDSLGWDSLMQGLFGTSYNLNAHGFAWREEYRIHPSGNGDWSAEDANLDDAAVIVLNASGKTGMAFAHQVKRNRPTQHQPRVIIGVGSRASKQVIEQSGFYDEVAENEEIEKVHTVIEKTKPRRTVLIDFGARVGACQKWRDAFSSPSTTTVPFFFVSVGAEVKVQHPDEVGKRIKDLWSICQVNASLLREKGIELGGDAYFDAFYQEWENFKAEGAIPRTKLEWGRGVKAWAEGWERLCEDEVPASTGLVYEV